jgi:ankyrin repeat protein
VLVSILALAPTGRHQLRLAAMNGHEQAVKALLAAGADVNALSARGTTPLDEGLSRGKLGVSKLVCEAGGELASALLGKE